MPCCRASAPSTVLPKAAFVNSLGDMPLGLAHIADLFRLAARGRRREAVPRIVVRAVAAATRVSKVSERWMGRRGVSRTDTRRVRRWEAEPACALQAGTAVLRPGTARRCAVPRHRHQPLVDHPDTSTPTPTPPHVKHFPRAPRPAPPPRPPATAPRAAGAAPPRAGPKTTGTRGALPACGQSTEMCPAGSRASLAARRR